MKTKNFSFILAAALFCLPSFAQLKVYQNGNVNVKSTDSTSTVGLSIGSSTYPSAYSVYLSSSNPSTADYNIGVEGRALRPTAQSSGRAIGVRGVAGNCTPGYNYGVYGTLVGDNKGAAVLGTVGGETGVQVWGKYAGYFSGDIMSTGVSKTRVVNTYDMVQEEDPLTYALGLVNSLHPMKRWVVEGATPILEDTIPLFRPGGGIYPNSKLHYCLNPDSILSSSADLVIMDANGNKYVNYTELIPVLVAAIQELHALYTQSSAANSTAFDGEEEFASLIPSRVESPSATSGCHLYQNTPNPFTSNTMIKYSVPATVGSAFLYIFDMRGTLMRQMKLDTGSDRIVIAAGELQPGMYLYSLIVDGNEVDTKRMIISK